MGARGTCSLWCQQLGTQGGDWYLYLRQILHSFSLEKLLLLFLQNLRHMKSSILITLKPLSDEELIIGYQESDIISV